MIDLSIYLTAAVAGVPILFLVFGIVEILKKITRPDGSQAISGNGLIIASLVTGLVLGLGFIAWQTEPPAGSAYQIYQYWFAACAYGLGLGILASLFFDTLKALAHAAIDRMITRRQMEAASIVPQRLLPEQEPDPPPYSN